MTAAYLQSIGAVLGGLGTLVGALTILANRSKITAWFKRRETLIIERNVALQQVLTATAHAESSAEATKDYKDSVDALRVQLESTNMRLRELESVRPLYDAFVLWVPRVLEYVVWIETLAKRNSVDLAGRQMPQLPQALIEHFSQIREQL